MGALKVWTGSQWTETGGGLRDVPAGVLGAKARHSTTQSITNSTDTALLFDEEDWDTDAFHSTSTNTSRFTIPAGLGGKYLVFGKVYWAADATATGTRIAKVYVDGSEVDIADQREPNNDSLADVNEFTTVLDLTAGQYVEFYVKQTSGGALNAGSATDSANNVFGIYKLGSGTVGDAIGARVTPSSNPTVTSPEAKVAMGTTEWDSDGFFDDANDRLTVPAGLAGEYILWGMADDTATATTIYLALYVNGSLVAYGDMSSGTYSGSLAIQHHMDVGDYVELWGYRSTSGTWQRVKLGMYLLATSGVFVPGPRTPGYTFDYTEKTTATSVTSTSSSSPDTIVSSGAVTYDGTQEVDIEFWAAGATPSASAGATLVFQLWDGGTNIGTFGYVYSQAANNAYTPVCLKRRVTPSSGSHTYHVKAYVSTGTATVSTGAGGSGNNMPGYIKITRA